MIVIRDRYLPSAWSASGFLTLGAVAILSQIMPCRMGAVLCIVGCLAASLTFICPLDASSNSPVVTMKNESGHHQMSRERVQNFPLVETHRVRQTSTCICAPPHANMPASAGYSISLVHHLFIVNQV